MKNHVSFHTSHVLYRPYKKKEKKKRRSETSLSIKKAVSPKVVVRENCIDRYGNDMPPRRIVYHFTPLTCCTDHTRKKKNEREKTFLKWGPSYMIL